MEVKTEPHQSQSQSRSRTADYHEGQRSTSLFFPDLVLAYFLLFLGTLFGKSIDVGLDVVKQGPVFGYDFGCNKI